MLINKQLDLRGKYENWERITRKKSCEICLSSKQRNLEASKHIKASHRPVRISLPLSRLQTAALEKFPLDPSSYQNAAR